MKALRSGDRISASLWLGEDVPEFEGDPVLVSAELSDVDEVAFVVGREGEDEDGNELPADLLVHLSRVQAIALAGQLAAAATRSPADLPGGHVHG
jgi:hypothetical protein